MTRDGPACVAALPRGLSRFRLRHAVRLLHAGGLIVYPTEAVYGIGCDPRNPQALRRLLALKHRDPRKGLILVAASEDQLAPFLHPQTRRAAYMTAVRESWPGPRTWVLPCADDISPLLRGAHDTLAVRVTAHPWVAALCRVFGGPLVSTSANIASRPPARGLLDVRRMFGVGLDIRRDALLSGPVDRRLRPTPIRDARSGRVLRKG